MLVKTALKLLLVTLAMLSVFAVILVSGCICWFAPCDRAVHVSGHVRDTRGAPVKDAAVEFYGVTRATCDDGCFHFGGVLAAPGFTVAVSKPGYKPYREGRKFAYYDIEITLAPAEDPRQSTGLWRVLKENDLAAHAMCPEFDCNRR